MAFIDSTAVNVALPQVQRDLQSDAAGLQWVVEGYALLLSALIMIGGSLGDIFGRRLIFVAGIAIFAFASLGCAAAHSMLVLNLARCVQGAGAALATPGSLALISANFSGPERGRAIGTWSGFAAITSAIGPLLGGWLAQHASWRYVFVINVPLAVVVIAGSLARVPESRTEGGTRSVDIGGATLATLGLGALTYGLIALQTEPGSKLAVLIALAGVAVLLAFVALERRSPAPMIPVGIFRSRAFTGANIYTLLLYAALGGSLFFVPFDLQNVHAYTPSEAGAALLPFIVIMFAASRWSGGLVASIGARVPLIGGAVIEGIGFLAYAAIGVSGSYWTTFFPAAVLLGIGGALFVAPLTTTVMDSGGTAHAGAASGINNAVSRVAGLLAVAALGIVLANSLYASFDRGVAALRLSPASALILKRERGGLATGQLPPGLTPGDRPAVRAALRKAFTLGFSRTMLASALLSWCAAFVALLTIAKGPSARRPQTIVDSAKLVPKPT
jgi:EmrB/QacA subfamily drug resistance transporter